VSDTTSGSFTVRADNIDNPAITGSSGLITILGGDAISIIRLSSADSINVGGERLLQYALEDTYGNRLSDSLMVFRRFNGNGLFSNGLDSLDTLTNASGIAQANYTASDVFSFGEDSIEINYGTLYDTLSLPLRSSLVSYYTLSPSTDSTITAGDSIAYTVTARDQFGNAIGNDGGLNLLAQGSATAGFSPAPYNFNGDSTLQFRISDSLAGSFTVRVENTGNSAVSGTSGLITIIPDAATLSIEKISGDGSGIIAGTDQLLRVRVVDSFANVVSGDSIRFIVRQGGGNIGGLDSVGVATNASGIAEVNYTTGIVADSNIVTALRIVDRADSVQFGIGTVSGLVSYYTLTPAVDSTMSAGDSIAYTLKAFDQYDNAVANNDDVALVPQGSSTAGFSPGPYDFAGNDSLTFGVSDSIVGSFTVRATNNNNSSVTVQSGIISVTPDTLSYVWIRTLSNNGGVVYGDTSLTSDETLTLYSAGYDRFGNYRTDESVDWTTNGTLDVINSTGNSYVFAPVNAPATGRIFATPSHGVISDSTGIITVNQGGLAEMRIQSQRGADQAVYGDSSITTDDSLTLYAAGYDANGNYLGEFFSDWTVTGAIGNFTTTNPNDSILFDATSVGSGTIRAADTTNSLIYDQTGLVTVDPGSVMTITIRKAPDGGGSVAGTDTIMVGNSLTFYAAGYDADGNYVADSAVNWDSTGTLSGLVPPINNSDQVILSPDTPGDGQIFTTNSSGWTNDSTGTIVVQSGTANRIAIRTQPNNGGVELDTLTRAAGDSVTLFAAFYDYLDNYLGDQPVTWGVQGDSIGYYATSASVDSNTFYFTTVNSANFRIQSGSLTDNSGLVQVTAGLPNALTITSVQQQTGEANNLVLVDPEVAVSDVFGNRVPNILVEWSTPSDGSLVPSSAISDVQGLASSTWRLKSTLGADTAYAIVANVDTALFEANVVSASADSILALTISDTGVVTQAVSAFVIQVVDTLLNPVPGITVSFVVDSIPSGTVGYSLSSNSEVTDSTGSASTILTLGDKIGNYRIRAFNGLLKGSPVTFRALAVADVADSIIVYSGDQQSGTVGDTLGVSLQAQVTDQYLNPVAGTSVTWSPTADGDTIVTSDVSDVNGLVETQWILRTTSGNDTLTASGAGLGTAVFTATANNDVADTVIAYAGW
jgi:hypothetical protein